MTKFLHRLWKDEQGDMVQNLGLMLVLSLGLGFLVHGFTDYVERSAQNWDGLIGGVQR